MKSSAGREDFLLDPFHIKLLGCLAGLRAVANMGITYLVVETNATLDKTMLEENEYQLSAMGGVITELELMMSAQFSCCKISICKRDCNKVAHAFVAFGCKCPSGYHTTSERVPQFIEDLVTSNLAGSNE